MNLKSWTEVHSFDEPACFGPDYPTEEQTFNPFVKFIGGNEKLFEQSKLTLTKKLCLPIGKLRSCGGRFWDGSADAELSRESSDQCFELNSQSNDWEEFEDLIAVSYNFN